MKKKETKTIDTVYGDNTNHDVNEKLLTILAESESGLPLSQLARKLRMRKAEIMKTLGPLIEDGEVIFEKDDSDQELCKLTLMGKLHYEKGDDGFNAILEANYVRMLIAKGSPTVEGPGKNNDYFYEIEDAVAGCPDDIKLLKANRIRGWTPGGELRECIIVPPSFDSSTLKHDISCGAYPFKPLEASSLQDLKSNIVFFRCTKLEYGYKSAEYFLAIQRELERSKDPLKTEYSADPDTFSVETWNPEEAGTISNLMPIVSMEAIAVSNCTTTGIGAGSFSWAGQSQVNQRVPYWKLHKGPILIVKNDGIFDNNLTDCIESLKNSHTHIYVVYLESEHLYMEEGEEDTEFPMGNADYLRALVKHDAASFDISPADDTPYLDKVLTGICSSHNLVIPNDYPRNELIDRTRKITEDMISEFIDGLMAREANRNPDKTLSLKMMKLLGRLETKESGRLHGWDLINSMQGMEEQKNEIRMLINSLKYNKARKMKGYTSESIIAILFAGPPGSGKTQFGQALADILATEGVLPDNKFVSVTGAGLQAEYVGMTCGKVDALVNTHSVIFIDEAYSLSTSAKLKSPYAEEALAELLVLMEEAQKRGNKLFIFAGYGGSGSSSEQNKIKEFLESNPGIKSRVACVVDFKPYSAGEMSEIFLKICKNNGYKFAENEINILKETVSEYFNIRVRDPQFGNGREARTLCSQAMAIAANRIMADRTVDDISEDELRSMTVQDVQAAIQELYKMERAREGEGTGAKKVSLINN